MQEIYCLEHLRSLLTETKGLYYELHEQRNGVEFEKLMQYTSERRLADDSQELTVAQH